MRWLIDGRLVRTDTVHVPQAALALHINIWAPDSIWPDAYSNTLQPTGDPATSVSWIVDVDYARVALFGPASPSAIADLNGDGMADILWQNSSGEVAVWELNGTAVIGAASLANPGPTWHV